MSVAVKNHYAVTNPATGEQIKAYPTITDDELEAAIALAHQTHQNWLRSTPVEERAKLVRRVGELHTERREQLAEITVREMGKPTEQALGEIDFCADIYGYYADNGADLMKDEPIELLAGDSPAAVFSKKASPPAPWRALWEIPAAPPRQRATVPTSSTSSRKTSVRITPATASRWSARPHVDRFASQGIRFNHAYTCGPVCSASRSALMTGCYQSQNRCASASHLAMAQDPSARAHPPHLRMVPRRRLLHLQPAAGGRRQGGEKGGQRAARCRGLRQGRPEFPPRRPGQSAVLRRYRLEPAQARPALLRAYHHHRNAQGRRLDDRPPAAEIGAGRSQPAETCLLLPRQSHRPRRVRELSRRHPSLRWLRRPVACPPRTRRPGREHRRRSIQRPRPPLPRQAISL